MIASDASSRDRLDLLRSVRRGARWRNRRSDCAHRGHPPRARDDASAARHLHSRQHAHLRIQTACSTVRNPSKRRSQRCQHRCNDQVRAEVRGAESSLLQGREAVAQTRAVIRKLQARFRPTLCALVSRPDRPHGDGNDLERDRRFVADAQELDSAQGLRDSLTNLGHSRARWLYPPHA
jgi:hypothetical protein